MRGIPAIERIASITLRVGIGRCSAEPKIDGTAEFFEGFAITALFTDRRRCDFPDFTRRAYRSSDRVRIDGVGSSHGSRLSSNIEGTFASSTTSPHSVSYSIVHTIPIRERAPHVD